MGKEIRERFGILIRPSGRMELVQLGIEDGSKGLLDTLEDYFGGTVEYVRNEEGLAYVTREGAFDDGMAKNAAGEYFAGIAVFGDVIVLPKRDPHGQRVRWNQVEAYKQKVRMECDWAWYVDYSADPEKYTRKLKKA